MALLEACLTKNVRLVDYECITQGGKKNGKRLIAFGSWAGRAGMIDALRGFGERFLSQGFSTPFLNMGSSYMYSSFEEARRAVLNVGEAIRRHGLPQELGPFVVVFTSNGKASRGAQEIFELLPHQWVSPSELKDLPADTTHLFGCVVNAEDMVVNTQGTPFDRQEYYTHGASRYTSTFHEQVYLRIPHTHTLTHGSTHARTPARAHASMHARTHTRTLDGRIELVDRWLYGCHLLAIIHLYSLTHTHTMSRWRHTRQHW